MNHSRLRIDLFNDASGSCYRLTSTGTLTIGTLAPFSTKVAVITPPSDIGYNVAICKFETPENNWFNRCGVRTAGYVYKNGAPQNTPADASALIAIDGGSGDSVVILIQNTMAVASQEFAISLSEQPAPPDSTCSMPRPVIDSVITEVVDHTYTPEVSGGVLTVTATMMTATATAWAHDAETFTWAIDYKDGDGFQKHSTAVNTFTYTYNPAVAIPEVRVSASNVCGMGGTTICSGPRFLCSTTAPSVTTSLLTCYSHPRTDPGTPQCESVITTILDSALYRVAVTPPCQEFPEVWVLRPDGTLSTEPTVEVIAGNNVKTLQVVYVTNPAIPQLKSQSIKLPLQDCTVAPPECVPYP